MPRHSRKLLIYGGIFLRFTSKWILWASVHGEWVAERMASWRLSYGGEELALLGPPRPLGADHRFLLPQATGTSD